MGRTLRRLGLVLCGLLLSLGIGELVARSILGEPLGSLDLARTREALLELRGRLQSDLPMPGETTARNYKAAGKLVVHPYLGFDSPSSNAQLSRELESYSRPDPRRLRVLLLGGSVAGIFGRLSGTRLKKLLEGAPQLQGRKVDLMPYGRGGYKQPQHLIRLVELLSLGIEPDIVINLDGFNEVALGANNIAGNVHPFFPPYAHWLPLVHSAQNRGEVLDAYAEVRRASGTLTVAVDGWLESGLSRSALYTLFARRRISGLERRQGRARAAYFARLAESELEPSLLGPSFEGDREQAARLAARIWFDCSIQLHKLCQANGIEYLQFLQPTLYDVGAKPISDLEREKCPLPPHWETGVYEGYPLLREFGAQLRERGVRFVDTSRIFAEVEESLYYDACHFGQEGNDMLAEAIARALVEVLDER